MALEDVQSMVIFYRGMMIKMRDYIDRDEALNCFPSWIDYRGDAHDPDENPVYESIASLEDPIIRCMDCRYYQDNNGGYPHESCKWKSNETPDPEDFCSGAERLE